MPHSDPRTTVEERRFTAALSDQKITRASAPVEAPADTTHAASQKTFVIPNRAESPVRNLPCANAITNFPS